MEIAGSLQYSQNPFHTVRAQVFYLEYSFQAFPTKIQYLQYLSYRHACYIYYLSRFCGLVVRVPGYRSRGPGSLPGTTRFSEGSGLERGPLSLVSTIEELLGRKISGLGLEI
jgi:hypothetical protein